MSTVLDNLKYSESDEWVEEVSEGVVKVGITDYAQNEMGDLVFVNLPEVGDEVTAGETFADVESVKAVAEVKSPVTGVVTAINEEILDAPEKINEDAYGAWFIEVSEISASEDLMDAAAYTAKIGEA